MSNPGGNQQPRKSGGNRSQGGKSGSGQQRGRKQGGGSNRGGQAGRGNKGRSQRGRGKKPSLVDDRVQQLAGPLSGVLRRLPETQRRVLELRMGLVDGHPRKLSETAEELGLSMQEAKEIEARAFEHIREAIPLGRLKKLLKD